MEQKVDTRKNVFNKAQYSKTIDTSFKEFGVTTISDDLQSQPTIEQFFELYNQLFYDIPPNGETNSHEFLVQQSGEYINFEANAEEIRALQDEIANLREELLSSQIQIAQAASGVQIPGSPGSLAVSGTSVVTSTSTSTTGRGGTGGGAANYT
jgi:hypothetical protein